MTTLHDDRSKLRLIHDTGFDRHFQAEEWAEYNRQFFDGLAKKYDATNWLHAMGTKRIYYDRLSVARLPIGVNAHLLDLCTGSGDIAIRMARAHPDARVTGVDASPRMLEVARRKARKLLDRVRFLQGDALALDFPDDHFDGAVISFGLRNLSSLERGLTEMRRVVRPGGFVCNIDTGKPRPHLFRFAYGVQSRRITPALGKLMFHLGEYNSFRYVPESNRYFPHQDVLVEIFERVGLERVRLHEYWFGAVAQQIGIVPGGEPA